VSEEQKKTAQERLQGILGFDPAKNKAGQSVLTDALAEIKKDRDEQNKQKASELIKKAIACVEKMEDAKKQFNAEINKAEKELGKLVSSIEQLGGGN
jgi:uncharacterized protein YpuA (DUF1002 family)